MICTKLWPEPYEPQKPWSLYRFGPHDVPNKNKGSNAGLEGAASVEAFPSHLHRGLPRRNDQRLLM